MGRKRQATLMRDTSGAVLATVPLGPQGKYHCKIEIDSLEQLLNDGHTDQFNYIVGPTNGKIYVTIKDKASQKTEMVGRLVAGANKNQWVKYINGDPLDLRKENIRVIDYKRRRESVGA